VPSILLLLLLFDIMIPYRSYLKKRFGANVLKIPVNAGFSCPNRDGTKSFDGCAFCDNRAFSPVHASLSSPIDQVSGAIDKCHGKYKLFLPYLQPFSNTYAPVGKLKSVYEPLLSITGVIGLAVGTRPDCFDESIYNYLADVNKRAYISVELGLQSGHDSVLEGMNRGHTARDFKDAVLRLDRLGIETAAHVILGLPGETESMVEETAAMLAGLPVSGVKVHQLMIIAGTPLEQMYRSGRARALSIEEYAALLRKFLAGLRPEQHIHRLAADSKPEHGLIAPMWSADKTKAVNYIKGQLGCKP
jgi:radical SAM protein (TIGR01212 family)